VVQSPAGAVMFLSLRHRVQTGRGTHLASYPVFISCCYSGGKAAGLEADHSPLSSAEVKSAWSYISTPNTSSQSHV